MEKIEYKKLRKMLFMWHNLLNIRPGYSLCEELALRNGSINPFFEMGKYFAGYSDFTFPLLVMATLEKMLPSPESAAAQQLLQERDEMRTYFTQLLGMQITICLPVYEIYYHLQDLTLLFLFFCRYKWSYNVSYATDAGQETSSMSTIIV